MLEAFQRHLEASSLCNDEQRVLVGYSGGADSTCLLHLLQLSGIDVVAAHLNHGQREEAEFEALQCRRFAESLNIPFMLGNANVPLISQQHGVGLEEAGRMARYDFFTRAARASGCQLIATAHTRTDLAETVLLNMTRGSGLAGLSGIPERNGNIIRPLLIFSREQTRGYCSTLQFWTHDDPANEDVSFSRARIRHRVIPELELINPRVEAAIAKLAGLAREEDEFLDAAAAAGLELAEIKADGPLAFLDKSFLVRFDRARLTHLPTILLRRALRLAASALGGNLDHGQVAALLDGLQSEPTGSVTSELGKVLVKWDAEEVLCQDSEAAAPYETVLDFPGETTAQALGWTLTIAKEKPEYFVGNSRQGLCAQLNLGKIAGPLLARSAKPGDRMVPFGYDHHRKLTDILSEFGLSEVARKVIPIIADDQGPVWIPGVCLGSRCLPENGTESYFLTFGPVES